jgi:hypothetical protein
MKSAKTAAGDAKFAFISVGQNADAGRWAE